MDSKHTQGPWELSGGDMGEWYIGADDWNIAQTFGFAGDGEGNEESDANARLIAAAPDLLEALKELVAANEAVQLALCDGPEVPGFDRSVLSRAQQWVDYAEKRARLALSKAEAPA